MKLLDCTIRDGGLMNQWRFTPDIVRDVVLTDIAAGIEYAEIGYRVSETNVDPRSAGPWRFCREEDLRRLFPVKPAGIKLGVMADIGRSDAAGFLPARESLIDFVRVACYLHQVEEGTAFAAACRDMGYEVYINLMAVSQNSRRELESVLAFISENMTPHGVYVVDSFGSMDMAAAAEHVELYGSYFPASCIGFHGHNNRQLAYANTIAALQAGAGIIDATYFGIGRGAGNCPIELILPGIQGHPDNIGPVVDLIGRVFEPMKNEIGWGYRIPYAISGMLNVHPSKAIDFCSSGKTDYAGFLRLFTPLPAEV